MAFQEDWPGDVCAFVMAVSHVSLAASHGTRNSEETNEEMAGVVSDRGNLSSRDAKQFDKMIAPLSGGSSIEK